MFNIDGFFKRTSYKKGKEVMKWAMKPPVTIGTKTHKIKFAFLPIQTHDGYWVWLEKYLLERVYMSCQSWGGRYDKWESFRHHNESYAWRKYNGQGTEADK